MSKKIFLILLYLVILVSSTGLLCDVFLVDSALYASISKSFSASGNYMDIYVNGDDWLDKPHFPFWVSGLFIKIFGVNTFAYKLPSLLFFIVGLAYTYKLAKEMFNKEVAYLATLILGSSFHIILSNNDVRAESILLGLIMGAMYYLYKLTSDFSMKNLLLASIFSAGAIMTKGLFVLIIFYSAIFLSMVVQKEYKKILNIRWVLVLLLTFLFISPEIYALYHQFDLHPEKEVFGQNHVSGIKFFLWDSQFGRFFNTGPIKGSGDVFFFIHTLLWAFAPWALIGFFSFFKTSKKLWKKVHTQEYIIYFGFLVMFVVFSISRFQLPHYTNILFPFISIMIANLLVNSENNLVNKILKFSINLYSILFVATIVLLEYFFRTERGLVALIIFLIMMISIILINSKKVIHKYKFIFLGISSTLLLFLYLNLCFYPKLLSYQSGSQIAFYINEHYPKEDVMVNYNDYLLQYYSKNDLSYVGTIDELKRKTIIKNKILVTNKPFLKKIRESGLNVDVLKTFDSFHITQLNKDFIYHKTRNKAISHSYLVKVKSKTNK